MNYRKIYEQIIEHAKRKEIIGYSEKHHIIPRSMGGTNNPENLVALSAREHYITHWLLWKIHKSKSMGHAFFNMVLKSDGQNRSFSSRKYEIAKSAMIEAMSGENNQWYGTHGPMGGKTHTEEFKILHKDRMKKASEYKRGKPVSEVPGFNTGGGIPTQFGNQPPWNKGITGEQSHMFGFKLSEETKERMRKPKEKVTCPHCGKIGGISSMKRWHFERCRNK